MHRRAFKAQLQNTGMVISSSVIEKVKGTRQASNLGSEEQRSGSQPSLLKLYFDCPSPRLAQSSSLFFPLIRLREFFVHE